MSPCPCPCVCLRVPLRACVRVSAIMHDPTHRFSHRVMPARQACPISNVVELLGTKCPEWGVLPEAAQMLGASVMQHPDPTIDWAALVAIIEKLAEPPTGEAPAAE